MSITVTVDEKLKKRATDLTGIHDDNQLFQAALQALVQTEASRRLIALGGSDPDAKAAPRGCEHDE